MSDNPASQDRGGAFVHANGIDIHYVEMGDGEPLVLLHGGVVSTGPIWNNHPVSYNEHLSRLAEHFRVIAPDTRGAGATVHKNGTASFALLAEDVLALIDALRLDRPMIGGFSEGGITATLVGITPARFGARHRERRRLRRVRSPRTHLRHDAPDARRKARRHRGRS